MDTVVAKWESKSGKHWVTLTRDKHGYSFRAGGAGGYLGNVSESDAVKEMERRVAMGIYQPDANKTPMRRTF